MAAQSHAAAQANADEPIEEPPRLELEPPSQVGYRVGLALTYMIAPALLSIGVATEEPGVVVATIPVVLLAGPLYHELWREHGNAKRAFAGTALSVLAVGTAGLLLGVVIGAARQSGDSCGEGEEGCWAALVGMVAGSATGAGLGYLGWMVYDVVTAERRHPPRRRPSERAAASVEPVLAPLVSAQEGRAAITGAVLGVSGRL